MRRAFTLIELLVVVSIIAVLLAITLVAAGGALSSSRKAATERLLASLSSAIEQFKNDHGYYPPLLNPEDVGGGGSYPPLVSEAAPNAFGGQSGAPLLLEKRYYSVHSLATYLVGVGSLLRDPSRPAGSEDDRDDGVTGPGFRSPGPDMSWGGARDRTPPDPQNNKPFGHQAPATGRAFGPYVDLAQNKSLRRATPAEATADQSANQQGAHIAENLYLVTDRWDIPIRYYRHWPTRVQSGPLAGQDSLAEVPVELLNTPAATQFANAPLVPISVDPAIFSAPYALLSAGEDQLFGEEGYTTPGGPHLIAREFAAVGNPADKKRILKRLEDNIRFLP